MQPVPIIDFRFVATSFGWQPLVPQLMCAMRKSPGLTNRTYSGDSWLSSVYDRGGLPDDGQPCGCRGRGWASSFTVAHGSPPWQSVQPNRTVALACGSPELAWQVTQPVLLRSTSAAVCSMRLTPAS